MWEFSSGFRGGNQHDQIQRHLYRKLREYAKQELEGVSWFRDDDRHGYRDDSVIQTEKQLNGGLPSGKSYCRADLALRIAERSFAFEIKTSASDAMNWPEQERDYRSAGYLPVIVTTPQVVADLAPGHRLVTGSEHALASEGEVYFQTDKLPETLKNHFGSGRPISEPLDRCPCCGYKLQYMEFPEQLYHRCKACDWTAERDD